MTCGPGWSGQRTHRSKTCSKVNVLQIVQQCFYVLVAALQFKTQNAAKPAHLFFCDVVAGMTLQPGIVHLRYFWMLIQKRCDGHRILILTVYAKLQRFHTADNVICRFGMKRSARDFAIVEDSLN